VIPMRTTVLVTRPEPMASETAARIAALGQPTVIAPMLEITSLPVRLPDPSSIQAVLVTSAAAVPALPESHRKLPLLAVGDMTGERAKQAGFTTVHSAGADARALADLAARLLKPSAGPLLLAIREGLGEPLELDLYDRGFTVLRHAVYTAVPVSTLPEAARKALEQGVLRAAMFFSADTARAFVQLVGTAGLTENVAEIDALAIGEPAAVALRHLPWRSIKTAAHPTQDEMLALLR
jgi:uroporphyrinogen-III synthase